MAMVIDNQIQKDLLFDQTKTPDQDIARGALLGYMRKAGYDVAVSGSAKKKAWDDAVTRLTSFFHYAYQYLVDRQEIKGITTEVDALVSPRTIETYTAGTGSHGGNMSGLYPPPAGAVNTVDATTAKQTNDGTGRVL